MKIIQKHLTDDLKHLKNQMTYNWFISRYCNKVCEYCISSSTTTRGIKSFKFTEDELLIHKKIKDYLKSKSNCQICLIGGEPTTHPMGIKYFNEFCQNSLIDDSIWVIMLTHGDLNDDQIEEFDHHNKKMHVVLTSYHPSQTNFNEWLIKIKKLKKRGINILIILLIPISIEEQKHIREVWEILLDNDLFVFGRILVDNFTNDANKNVLNNFEDLLKRSNVEKVQMLSTFDSFIKDDDNSYILKYYESLIGVEIIPKKTICHNRQMSFHSNKINTISTACSQSNKILTIDLDTTFEEIDKCILDNRLLRCMKTRCIENSCSSNTIYVDNS